jgi:hypothetical protein
MATKRFASLAVDEIEKKKMLINAKETMKSNQKAARTLDLLIFIQSFQRWGNY